MHKNNIFNLTHLKYTISFLLLSILFYSCNSKDQQTQQTQKTKSTKKQSILIDIDFTEKKEPISLDKLISDVKFIPLETTDSCLIANIDKIIFYKNEFYLLDKTYSTLKVFDSAGKYIRAIGNLGQGPGEFTELKDFIVSKNNSLLLLCNDKRSVLEFDPQGSYIKSKRTNLFASSFDVIKDNFYYYINQNESEVSLNYNLLKFDSTGFLKQRMFSFPKSFGAEISFSGFLIRNTTGLLFSPALSDTAYQINNEEIYPKYIFSFGENSLPLLSKNIFEKFIQDGFKYSYLGNSFIDSKEVLSFSYYRKGKYLFGLYNKKTTNINLILPSSDDILTHIISAPVALKDENTFISFVSASQVLKQLTKHMDLKKNNLQLYKYFTKIQGTDNPILIEFKLSNF